MKTTLKSRINLLLRRLHIIKCADKARFYLIYIKTYRQRQAFRKSHSDVVLPPPYYIYETFGLDYAQFYNDSIETAKWLVSRLSKYKCLENAHILDWGCGPGRIIRHIPDFVDKSCQCYGTDYNRKYVDWCAANIPAVVFKPNNPAPPLPFDDNTFDVVYGISIFTHLSEKMHYAWFDELMRVMKPGGILFLTLHGRAFREKLSEADRRLFDVGRLVVLSGSKEGHRTYAAFHPADFVRKLAGDGKIIEYEAGTLLNGKPQQDVWIFQKQDQ